MSFTGGNIMEESEEQPDGQPSDTSRRKRHSREERFRSAGLRPMTTVTSINSSGASFTLFISLRVKMRRRKSLPLKVWHFVVSFPEWHCGTSWITYKKITKLLAKRYLANSLCYVDIQAFFYALFCQKCEAALEFTGRWEMGRYFKWLLTVHQVCVCSKQTCFKAF